MVGRERAGWRISAVLLALVLAFGAAICRAADADRPGRLDTPSPAAVMVADPSGTAVLAGERPGHPRLMAGRGHGGALLFVLALAALLAALLPPGVRSRTTSWTWTLPAAVGASTSRGRAPPSR
ncbi:hypothetical protein [Planosporangium mesophilum]|uniref:Uncharacterized protein n=1 Tax=Planosporangium mesophilum TaxID=689768 RepID=A0A8J3T984_9ACTN|nr:hypothetical protein [Planosporangium mesophilum]NJC84112.1 hypothetical protein [Planosporangium mesophilum]GII22885.1 hypothetical protein Pme01_24820 [Planosporangium mesophilum]